MKTFELSGEYIELNKLLKAAALVASGGEAGAAVAGGRVKVNGVVESRKRCKLRRGDVVEFDAGKVELR